MSLVPRGLSVYLPTLGFSVVPQNIIIDGSYSGSRIHLLRDAPGFGSEQAPWVGYQEKNGGHPVLPQQCSPRSIAGASAGRKLLLVSTDIAAYVEFPRRDRFTRQIPPPSNEE